MLNIKKYIKEYGFILKNSAIYNGIKSVYDYGPLGILLKNNIKELWWITMLGLNKNLYPIETAIFTHKNIWEKSKHKKKFIYYVIINKKTKKEYKILKFINKYKKYINKYYKKFFYYYKNNNIKKIKKIFVKYNFCKKYILKKKKFMYKVKNNIYLRPEISQEVYINFINLLKIYNYKVPFGIIQIGKSFRNEYLSNEFIFRMNEFEQMEMQYFHNNIHSINNYNLWLKKRLLWYEKLNIKNIKVKKNIYLPHYASISFDILYKFKDINKYKEIEGIHLRNKDLLNHVNKLFNYKFIKNISIIETSLGLDRLIYLLIDNFLCNSKITKNKYRLVLKLPYYLSPIKCAIFPLFKKKKILKIAKNIFKRLKILYMCIYDDKKSIGKRYRKQDAIGTPYCITVDEKSILDKKITIRSRDSMKQKRIYIKKILKYLKNIKLINFFKK
ncbi:MAG: glycine--tRNA ligase [Candidatus Shikimatogenerans sp. Tduv]|uniref:Glycine--tRNA ligase n=1 Tax=Candidatus Shikimatogenerans sp. Tduv TaxID=3158567 RepID=A0AAU7QR14_9FLAO